MRNERERLWRGEQERRERERERGGAARRAPHSMHHQAAPRPARGRRMSTLVSAYSPVVVSVQYGTSTSRDTSSSSSLVADDVVLDYCN
jgi:hypothetical protein